MEIELKCEDAIGFNNVPLRAKIFAAGNYSYETREIEFHTSKTHKFLFQKWGR